MSEIVKFIKQRLAGDPRPDVFLLDRTDERGEITLEPVGVTAASTPEDISETIEEAIRDDLSSANGSVDYTVKAQTRDGRACGARSYRRKGLARAPQDSSGRSVDRSLADLVGSTLERTGAMQVGLYDRLQRTIDQQERIIIRQNETISELAAMCAESGHVTQDPGQAFALSRIGELAGKAVPLLGAVLAKQGLGGGEKDSAGFVGKYSKLRPIVSTMPDADYEAVAKWIQEAGVGPDILARLSDSARTDIITVITNEGL